MRPLSRGAQGNAERGLSAVGRALLQGPCIQLLCQTPGWAGRPEARARRCRGRERKSCVCMCVCFPKNRAQVAAAWRPSPHRQASPQVCLVGPQQAVQASSSCRARARRGAPLLRGALPLGRRGGPGRRPLLRLLCLPHRPLFLLAWRPRNASKGTLPGAGSAAEGRGQAAHEAGRCLLRLLRHGRQRGCQVAAQPAEVPHLFTGVAQTGGSKPAGGCGRQPQTWCSCHQAS